MTSWCGWRWQKTQSSRTRQSAGLSVIEARVLANAATNSKGYASISVTTWLPSGNIGCGRPTLSGSEVCGSMPNR